MLPIVAANSLEKTIFSEKTSVVARDDKIGRDIATGAGFGSLVEEKTARRAPPEKALPLSGGGHKPAIAVTTRAGTWPAKSCW
jgi:hypothetical protein